MPNINIGKKFERLETLVKEGFVRMNRRFDGIKIEITDDIGRLVKQGFEQVDERFAHIDERFTQVDERFTQMEARFDRVDAQLDSANRRLGQAVYQPEFVQLEARITTLERRGRLRKT